MKGELIKCVRCEGRKKIFKVNSGYSHVNTGGIEIQCPMCLGNGEIKTLEEAIKDIKEENKQHKIKIKDCKDGKRSREFDDKA